MVLKKGCKIPSIYKDSKLKTNLNIAINELIYNKL